MQKIRIQMDQTHNRIVADTRRSYEQWKKAESIRDLSRLQLDLAREELTVLMAKNGEGQVPMSRVEQARLEEGTAGSLFMSRDSGDSCQACYIASDRHPACGVAGQAPVFLIAHAHFRRSARYRDQSVSRNVITASPRWTVSASSFRSAVFSAFSDPMARAKPPPSKC